MQLVDQKNEAVGKSWSRYSTRRWSIPCARTSGRCSSARSAPPSPRSLTALKTGNVLLWPCACADHRHRHGSRLPDAQIRTAHPGRLTFEQAKHWEPRYAIGAMVYASVLGVWCFLTIFGNDDAVAHMICVAGDGRLHRRRRGPQLRPAQADPVSHPAGLRPDVAGAGDARPISSTSASPALLALFFIGLKGINLSLHAIFVKALTSSFREAALAGQFDTALNNMPHGLCMFRADGRLAVMNHRFSEMMNLSDDLIQRGASAADIIAACITSDRFRRPAAR